MYYFCTGRGLGREDTKTPIMSTQFVMATEAFADVPFTSSTDLCFQLIGQDLIIWPPFPEGKCRNTNI